MATSARSCWESRGGPESTGFRPLFFVSEGQAKLEAEAVDVFLSEQVQEFICVSPTQQPHILRKAVENGFHVSIVNWDPRVSASVFEDVQHGAAKNTGRFGSHSVEKSIWEVKFDDLGAAVLATNHLLGLGHRKLAHLRGPDVRSSLLRLLGYRRALEAAGLWPQGVITTEDPVLEMRESALVCVPSQAAATARNRRLRRPGGRSNIRALRTQQAGEFPRISL